MREKIVFPVSYKEKWKKRDRVKYKWEDAKTAIKREGEEMD